VQSKSLSTYWDGVDLNGTAMAFRNGHKHAFTWPTHDGLIIAGVAWPARDFAALGDDDADRTLLATFDQLAPGIAPQFHAGERARRWMIGSVPNFFRTSHGPGWALVGDAAYTKDPITAAGISDAFRGAGLLATAIDEGLSGRAPMGDALARYQRRRDAMVLGHYFYTCDFARVSPYSRPEVELIRAMANSPRHAPGLAGLFAGIVPPDEFFSRESIHALYDFMPGGRSVGWESRMVRWMIKGFPGRFASSVDLADRLIAKKMGDMGDYLLASPRQ
jgi:hypothetical protein